MKAKEIPKIKKSGDDLYRYITIFKHRGSYVKSKKGKGSYSRKNKYKDNVYKEL